MRCTPFPDYLDFAQKLTSEQQLVAESVRQFCSREAQPHAQKFYMEEKFPEQLIPKLGELGLLGSNLSGYGLPGMDSVAYGLIMKELERCDSGLRSFASVQGALVMYPIHQFGSEEQKKEWLPELGKGAKVGCFGLTESDGGSDPGAMKTRAVYENGGWTLSGSKTWITNGNLADVSVVWAQTDDGIRGFVVPTRTGGFTAKLMKDKLSLRASVTSELFFDQIKLPEGAILPGSSGLKSALSCLTQARYGIAWGVLGAAEACFDIVCNYVKDRMIFGQPLAAKQLVQARLAKMITKITTGQLLALRLGELKDAGQLHFAQVSMGKQNNCQLALEVARDCRDLLGGNGIMAEYDVMRHMANLETVITYEGTNDVHQLIIGQQITGHPAY